MQCSAVATDLPSSLAEFVNLAHSLKGDEEREAQTFLDRFFRVLGPVAPARTEVRVIPVLLPAASESRVPLFARQPHPVDLRSSGDAKHRAAMQELVQAVLGRRGRFAEGF